MKRLAIFDFCDTIVNLQSADAFIQFVTEHSPSNNAKNIDLWRTPLKKLRLIPRSIHKNIQTSKLKGISFVEIEKLSKQFVDEIILPNLNKKVTERIEFHKKRGDVLVLVSAGYMPYLQHYGNIKEFNYVIGTELEVENDKLTGKIQGPDCYGKTKVELLKNQINLQEYDLQNSFVYSDDKSDLPLFELVGNKIQVTPQGKLTRL